MPTHIPTAKEFNYLENKNIVDVIFIHPRSFSYALLIQVNPI